MMQTPSTKRGRNRGAGKQHQQQRQQTPAVAEATRINIRRTLEEFRASNDEGDREISILKCQCFMIDLIIYKFSDCLPQLYGSIIVCLYIFNDATWLVWLLMVSVKVCLCYSGSLNSRYRIMCLLITMFCVLVRVLIRVC